MSTACFLIGVSKYKDDSIQDLPYCQNDLKQFGETLKSNLGLSNDEIFILGDVPGEATRSGILRFIKTSKSLPSETDTMILYFTGHGTSIANEGYLITHDTEPDILSDTAIPIERLKKELNSVNAKNKILFIDSCFSGAHLGKATGSSEDFFENLDDLINEGWIIFSSCKGDELSWFYEEEKLSVFTHYLIQAFNGHAVKDKDTNKLLFEDLNRYVTRNVAAWSLKNKTKSQTPTVRSERIGSFYFQLKKILTENEIDDDVSNKYMEITLQMSYKAPKGFSVDKDWGASLNPQSIGLLQHSNTEWIEYDEEEREEKADKKFNEILKKLHAIFLNHIKPSEINVDGEENIKLPFGQLMANRDKTSFDLKFTTEISQDDKYLDQLLFEIDDQDFIKWETVAFNFDNQFDVDELRDTVVDKNYKIEEYDPFNRIIKVNITPDDNSPFYMTFKNDDEKCIIEISERRDLRKDFLELIPATEMIEIFKDSFKK